MDEKFNRKWFYRASKKFREMREKKIFTDVKLLCQGGCIYAHKCVLMATNSFFSNLLDTMLHTDSDSTSQIEFKETSIDALTLVINALYGDISQLMVANMEIESILQILDTAHLIRESRLVKFCINLLLNRLSVENCVELWNITTKYEQKKAEKVVMKFMLAQLPSIVQENKLMDINANQMNRFVSYAAESLNVGDQLISLVIEWGKTNEKERMETVIILLDVLDKLAFSVDYVLKVLKDDCFIKANPQLVSRMRAVRSAAAILKISDLMSQGSSNSSQNKNFKCLNAVSNTSISSRASNISKSSSISKLTTGITKKSLCSLDGATYRTADFSNFVAKPNQILQNSATSKTAEFSNSVAKPNQISSHGALFKLRSSFPQVSTKSTLFSTFSSKSASSLTLPVHSDLTCNKRYAMQIHFYCVKGINELRSQVSTSQTYLRNEKKWLPVQELKLPFSLAKEWYPLATLSGEHFYFSISKENNFLVYSELTGQVQKGPSVASKSHVSGIADGTFAYVWNYESIFQFDIINETWKRLSTKQNFLIEGMNLLAVKGKLFFHADFPPSIYKYNFETEDWDLKKSFKESCSIKSIKCKCCHKECKNKLYFIVNERQLLTYDTESDEWVGKFIPEFASRIPLLMSCDESFIIFGDEGNKTKYFLYYPELNKLEVLENTHFSMINYCCITCDLSLKIL